MESLWQAAQEVFVVDAFVRKLVWILRGLLLLAPCELELWQYPQSMLTVLMLDVLWAYTYVEAFVLPGLWHGAQLSLLPADHA